MYTHTHTHTHTQEEEDSSEDGSFDPGAGSDRDTDSDMDSDMDSDSADSGPSSQSLDRDLSRDGSLSHAASFDERVRGGWREVRCERTRSFKVVSAGKKGLHSVARHIGVRGRAWLLSVVKLSSRRQRSGLKLVQLVLLLLVSTAS